MSRFPSLMELWDKLQCIYTRDCYAVIKRIELCAIFWMSKMLSELSNVYNVISFL